MTNTPKDKTPSEFKRFDFKREINAKTGIEKSWAEECSNGRYILFFDHEAAIAAERQKATTLEAKVEECRNVIVMQQDAIKIASDRIKALEGAIEEFLSYSYKSFPSHSEAIEEGLRIRELCQDLLNRKEALGSPLHQDGKVTPEFKAEVDKVIKHCDHILSRSGMDDEAPGDSAGPEKHQGYCPVCGGDSWHECETPIRKAEQDVIEAARNMMKVDPSLLNDSLGSAYAIKHYCEVRQALEALERAKGKEDGHE